MKNHINKKIAVLSIILSSISFPSFAGNSLESICSSDNGTLIRGKRISNYTTSTIWGPGGTNDPTISIKVDGTWYSIYSKDVVNGGADFGISSYLQTMALLGNDVDICVKDGVLRGVENEGHWQ